MSLFDSYDPERRAILEPSDVKEPIAGFPETVVVTFQPSLMETVAAMEGARVLHTLSAFFKLPIYQIEYGGKPLAVYQTLLGGAASAGLLEETAALGGRKFVLFGSCGSLDDSHPDDCLIVPTAAYREEGVSYHYLPPGDYVEVPTAARTAAILKELGLPHVAAKTWTTDGLYRETRRNMERRRAEGCLCVDMECASLAAVCQYRGLEFYQFFYTEDNLGGDAWDPRLMGKLPQDAKEAYLKIALEIARRI